ncbi:adenosylmethionine-8-amino-7-oxononanoate aminotransferase [Geosporobacter subterraneus DSM 17957]|uniref:Adenosylmethionine-8-amino-7-oxononanoate aminotransferase n=1 Tax=Geosporobacter subterraneus DSM 17957 TaxID=1121919 RepID=A0A1M6JTJ6_9FIRM|nr:adenosylmethionine--8-amino-7-oxononanoate transaminase [Geosporobacter subterraneus]SHJ50055.1 adenosylmethionine-8-amino-7-oxononanoate aminotransferase [Geosporobacter subterraneus DSM 17957]
MRDLQKKDLQYIWHPCSQMKDYEAFPPIVIDRGEGAYLYDMDGKSYLDAVSSWWVNLFGHSNKKINRAIAEQVDKLEHVIFANFSHRPAIELAEQIVKITPEGLNKVFFADNGSSAVEVALKLSFQYYQQIGKTKKTRFVAISESYHGETLGALSVGDIDLYNEIYKPLLLQTLKAEGPDCYRCKYGKTRETCNAECFESMKATVETHHEEIAGIIIEPMIQGAAGMKIYSPVYLKKLRELCTQYDVHMIADEIAVGFGRTGKMFACEHAGVSPDIMTLSKGLTAGYIPLSLTLMTDTIYEAFYDDYLSLKAFMHSHSYTGNPIGCAVACASLKIFEEERVLENNLAKSALIREKAEKLLKYPNVGEFRQLGMVGAIELVEDKAMKRGFDWQKRIGYQLYKMALKEGVLLRPLGNVIYFMPPYVVEEKDIDLMIGTTEKVIREFFRAY